MIRDLPLLASNYRNEQDLSEYLEEPEYRGHRRYRYPPPDPNPAGKGCPERLPDGGAMTIDEAQALAQARAFAGLKGMDLAKEVTYRASVTWSGGQLGWGGRPQPDSADAADLPWHVVAYDFGVKRNILRMLVDRGCRLTVVPAQTPASRGAGAGPGRGVPVQRPGRPRTLRLRHRGDSGKSWRPISRCSASASGTSCWAWPVALHGAKMKFGHHGANHPVQNLDDGTVLITSQNHGFAVDEEQSAGQPAGDPQVPVRRHPAGYTPHRQAGLQLPGPSRGQPGTPRRRAPVRPFYRTDGSSPRGGARGS